MNNGMDAVLIWGAGKIGRGFIGELFSESGFRLIFADKSQSLVEQLNNYGKYPVKMVSADLSERTVWIPVYRAIPIDDRKNLSRVLNEISLIIVSVPSAVLNETAKEIAGLLGERIKTKPNEPLDIIICSNVLNPGPSFKEKLKENKKSGAFVEENVGVVESLVIRMAPDTPEKMLAIHPLYVLTDDYPELPVDRGAFKGTIPEVKGLKPVENMRARETRKLYTYNLAHAVLAYTGLTRGYKLLAETLEDGELRYFVEQALEESSFGLQREFGFSEPEMKAWNKTVLERFSNPALGDTLERLGSDPRRKLSKNDRLIGAALLVLKHGKWPKYILKGAAAGFLFDKAVKQTRTDIIRITGLKDTGVERQIVDALEKGCYAFKLGMKAYTLGFRYERDYHGCGQCALAGIFDTLDINENSLFKATTAFAGGIGEATDGSCGGYIAGVLAMGLHIGRRRNHLNGDREEKYKTAELARELRNRFLKKYKSITCKNIHKVIFGRDFDLTSSEDRAAFDSMGAHIDKCTSVVGNASRWTVEILAEELLSMERVRELLRRQESI